MPCPRCTSLPSRSYDQCVPVTSREIRLVARPQGVPDERLFEVVEAEVPDPVEGQVLIRNAFLSVDPYMRGRMSDRRSYVAPFALGEAMTGGAVGRIASSGNADWPEGTWVLHSLGWREWALSDGHGLQRVDAELAPPSTALGVLGMPGFTAWYGLTELGQPQPGETVFVSAAAGAVGSVVGQIAAVLGCRAIGSAGSPEKLAWLDELGFEVSFSYRDRPVAESLRDAAPDGIDVYFDNVGGDHLEAAIGAMRTHGRVVACGAISRYNDVEPQPGPRNLFMLFTKRLTVRGFIISDHYDRYGEFLATMGPWVRDGRVRYRETVVEGIENAPRAFLGLLGGENLGKMLVRVGPGE
jgi:NADPH-dependent curcumin reductase CurA